MSSATRMEPAGDLGLLTALAGDFLQDSLADVTYIGGAAGEDFVLQRGQPVGVVLVGPAPGEFGGLPLVDAAHREVHQIRVAQDLPMRGEMAALSASASLVSRSCNASSWTEDRSMASFSR